MNPLASLLLLGFLVGAGVSPRSARKRQLRAQRYGQRVIDERDGETLISPLDECDHGTASAYNEYGCHCTDLGADNAPPDDITGKPVSPWGCKQAGIAAVQERRKIRRNKLAQTFRLPVVRRPDSTS